MSPAREANHRLVDRLIAQGALWSRELIDVFRATPRHHFLDHFFGRHPNAALQKRALKALRLLMACDEPLLGKPSGWAAGIVYAVANRDRQACGVPGLLNSGFEVFFGVSMATIRRQAARVAASLEW